MLQTVYRSKKAVDRNSIDKINKSTNFVLNNHNVASGAFNRNTMIHSEQNSGSNVQNIAHTISKMNIPQLYKSVQKGQKMPVSSGNSVTLDICMGWNVSNSECDIDVSAFLLGDTDKVIDDDWFVFYGQPDSPDGSVHFSDQSQSDREEITIALQKLNPTVKKIVFVLTIYDAVQKNLNFSMVSDAYIRILEHSSKQEIVSFKMSEYYSEVLSMMIGELYMHNGIWKFNAIGNGIAKELEGLCQLYGVQLK